jgi:hypothetical protein
MTDGVIAGQEDQGDQEAQGFEIEKGVGSIWVSRSYQNADKGR